MKNAENSHPSHLTSFLRRGIVILLGLLLVTSSVHLSAQETKDGDLRSLLILHTNDIHDHLRADYTGIGGLPFVSGYINKVRSQRGDILVLDAGDVAEKGELVARKTDSDFTFEMMRRVGYHAWAPGNHDHDFGIEALHRFTALANMDIVCINLLKEDGTPEFSPSVTYTINGIKIGIIGAIAPRDAPHYNLEETAAAMRDEAIRLRKEVDLIIGLMHISSRDATTISRVATEIDIFVTGHSHEKIEQPIKVPETGALLVQTGDYARFVGQFDLKMNMKTGKIDSYSYQLVEMNHLSIQPDLEMIELVRLKELELAPESQKVVSWTPRSVSYAEVGLLAAEALRVGTGADVSFHKTRHIIRAGLPPGILDVNAFYRTGGERGEHLVMVELSGIEINHYIQALPMNRWLPTQWSGFSGRFEGSEFVSDLNPEQMYRVVMPLREWDQRFTRIVDRVKSRPGEWPGIQPIHRELNPTALQLNWTDCVRILLEKYRVEGTNLLEAIEAIAARTGQQTVLQMSR